MYISVKNTGLAAVLLLCAYSASSQLVNGNAFLKGNFVEVGLAPYGCWGTTVDAPAGYHARSYMLTDGPNFRKLGFVADPFKDGWTTGIPTKFYGDYFLAQNPYTGYGFSIGNAHYFAERLNNGNPPVGMAPIPTGVVLSVTNNGTVAESVWETTIAGIRVRKIVTVPNDKAYFSVRTVFVNTTTAAIPDIYYVEYVNPDNDAGYRDVTTPTGNFNTTNRIVFQTPADGKSLVTATGPLSGSYLGLGSLDCRSRAFCGRATGASMQAGQTAIAAYYGLSTLIHTGGDQQPLNNFIGIAFNVGTIEAGDSAAVTFAYILAAEDLDPALRKTDPLFVYNNKLFESGDTILTCANNVLPVVLSNGDDMTWTWSPNTNINTTTGTNVNITAGQSPVVYTATGTGLCGTKSVNVVIAPVQPPSVVSPFEYCQNFIAPPLTAQGVDLLWFTAATGGTGSPVAPAPSTAAAGTTSYFVSQSSGNDCYGDRAEITVTVNPADNTTDNISICAAQLPYIWNGISVMTGGNGAATFTTQNRFGCDSIVVLNLTISPVPPSPAIHIVPSATMVCAGTPVTFAATHSNAGAAPILQWKKNGDPVGGNSETYTDNNLQAADVITCVLTTNEICAATSTAESNSVSIDIRQKPEIFITNSTDINCTAGSARLQASGGTRYEWSPTEGLSDPLSANPVATPVTTTTYTVTAFLAGCNSSKDVTVDVSQTGAYLVPNAFTPNGDGKNDCFGLGHWSNITGFRLNIYNRWGRMVFSSSTLTDCWNGDFINSKQPAGVYVYTIQGKGACGEINLRGNLMLVR